MEASFFRFLADDLCPLLNGRRIEKIYGPAPGVWTFKLQSGDALPHLIFRPAKSAGHLFLSEVKPTNPSTPAAQVMWFRKHVVGRRIVSCTADWPNLTLALELTPSKRSGSDNFLILDLRNGLSLQKILPENFGQQPDWPAMEDILSVPDIWKQHPQISPPLRKHIESLCGDEAHEEFLKIATAQVSQFFVSQKNNELLPPLAWKTADNDLPFDSAIEAANHYGAVTTFSSLDVAEEKTDRTRLKRARKKVLRNLNRLNQEEERLQQFIKNKKQAEALQAELYKIKDLRELEYIDVSHPEHGQLRVELNPFLTPLENMQRYFKLADKGERGMKHVQRRRQELENELQEIESGKLAQQNSAPREEKNSSPILPKRFKGLAASIFTTSDGFSAIRGKNKRANHDIISKAASAFDYWLHVADGPSSHVILRRDNPNQEVPESSLREAATLCALKSYRKNDRKADVMYALVKDVRKVKGFAHGQVVVDQTLGTIRVELDPSIEEKLKK